jgi:hypothetical protein
MTGHSHEYYEELQARARTLLKAVSPQLLPQTVELASEMIDANECGVAVETISEMLAEAGAPISHDVLMQAAGLVNLMGLDDVNVKRLQPLVPGERP